MAAKKNYNSDGRSAEDRTLDKFAELLIEKLETIQADWKKPWFTEGVTALPCVGPHEPRACRRCAHGYSLGSRKG